VCDTPPCRDGTVPCGGHDGPQHFLYFFPLPQRHGSLRPTRGMDRLTAKSCAVAAAWRYRRKELQAAIPGALPASIAMRTGASNLGSTRPSRASSSASFSSVFFWLVAIARRRLLLTTTSCVTELLHQSAHPWRVGPNLVHHTRRARVAKCAYISVRRVHTRLCSTTTPRSSSTHSTLQVSPRSIPIVVVTPSSWPSWGMMAFLGDGYYAPKNRMSPPRGRGSSTVARMAVAGRFGTRRIRAPPRGRREGDVSKTKTLRDAAIDVLCDRGPLHYWELTEQILYSLPTYIWPLIEPLHYWELTEQILGRSLVTLSPRIPISEF
jgi:hypothetical protein